MADYAFRNIEDRLKFQDLWERGRTPKELSEDLGKSMAVIYAELSRGRDGSRLPDQRLAYSAALAQQRVQRSLEQRGRKASQTTDCNRAAGQ